MIKRGLFWGSIIFMVIIMLGCTPSIQKAQPESTSLQNKDFITESIAEKTTSPPKLQPTSEPLLLGPSGCTSGQECGSYCGKNPFDCKVWCDLPENAGICDKYGIKIDIPSGIPGSPCTSDTDCIGGLICLNFKCDIPSPDNLAKKSGFTLPGGCTSMSDCAQYCVKPEHKETCLTFCENFPSFCTNLNEIRAAIAPSECQPCTTCNSKDCILDCTYLCYQYVPIPSTTEKELESLAQGITFEREYQDPIKAVWEPGPAYNRLGATYFIDEYKKMGINTYSITAKYNHKDGTLIHSVDHATGKKADTEKIATIIRAKKAGLQVVLVAHDLYDMFPDVSKKQEDINFADYYDDIESTSLKWAKIAEEYNVEYFVPVNEFEYVLYENGYSAEQACKITNELYAKIIPPVRKIFNGKIYCRVGGMDAKFGCMDFSQCDLFGFTYGFKGGNYKSNFESAFKIGEELSAKYNKKYIMAEAFMLLVHGQTVSDCINLHNAGMQAYKDLAKNGMGYTFMGLIQRDPIHQNDCALKDTPLVESYTNFFAWMDTNQKKSTGRK